MIELKKAQYPKAIEHIEKAVSLLPCQYGAFPIDDNQALFYQPLAEAYLRSGDLARARAQYEKIIALITGRVAWAIFTPGAFMRWERFGNSRGRSSRRGRTTGNSSTSGRTPTQA